MRIQSDVAMITKTNFQGNVMNLHNVFGTYRPHYKTSHRGKIVVVNKLLHFDRY